ncbi:MAG: hypothetical protein JSV49_04570 [Thermoplasmata archaeon]|nr:MAG: hypothetical protein JSV49_04570 [Thermoplasmata archaeon]
MPKMKIFRTVEKLMMVDPDHPYKPTTGLVSELDKKEDEDEEKKDKKVDWEFQ